MSNDFLEKIVNDMKSDTPGVVMQAMLSGTDKRIADERFISEVKKHKNDNTCLLNVPIGYVAKAALDVLGVEKYAGNNEYIINMINIYKKGESLYG